MRWNIKKCTNEKSLDIDAFLSEVLGVCKKHGLSISHEDIGGAFVVKKFNDGDNDWLFNAMNNKD